MYCIVDTFTALIYDDIRSSICQEPASWLASAILLLEYSAR